jgi:adenylylsulfate kinase-like enzyme
VCDDRTVYPPSEHSDREARPFALLLSGPAAAGKTTVACAWADIRPEMTAVVCHDAVREWIKPPQSRTGAWDDDAERRWTLAARMAAAAAAASIHGGIAVVLDVYAPPVPVPGDAIDWRHVLTGLPMIEVYLLPTFAACQERNAGRGAADRMTVAALRQNYADFEWCVTATKPRNVLDSTSMTVQETVSAVTEIVRASPLRE